MTLSCANVPPTDALKMSMPADTSPLEDESLGGVEDAVYALLDKVNWIPQARMYALFWPCTLRRHMSPRFCSNHSSFWLMLVHPPCDANE